MRYLNEELSNMSYTNKDFSTIYPELLEFADSISEKWKPSLSNESDPGVVLLKLAALMADKNNYNIDKNILELFPMSVTQYANAREIYEQCGYAMHYYQAAEVVVSMTPDNILVDPKADNSDSISKKSKITLPMFTPVSGADKSIAYTLICDLNDAAWEGSNIYPETIELQYGLTTDFIALQGKCNIYQINSNDYITYESLDYNNRLYFNERQIAENGIFITNVDNENKNVNNFKSWVRVDNLWTQAPQSYCYKLGISRDTGRVYIEFPSDIAQLIQNGLRIYYITTDGAKGSIRAKYLDCFLNNTCVPELVVDEDITKKHEDGLTGENIHITNTLVSSVGKDPETVDEAYKAYERYKNTFDTLVSIIDYNNYLRQDTKYLSNGFVCDRTNDIQHSYRIKSFYNGKVNNDLIQEAKLEDGPEYLNAFNLRIYGLKGSPSIANGTEDAFKLSFTPVTDNVNIGNLRDFIEDMYENTQTICHDFIPLTDGKLAFVFLEFVIDAKIIPYTKLDTLQQASVYGYVYSALLKLLNASNLEFGQAIDYDTLYDTIKNADNRIQSLILDDISYTPKYYVRSADGEIRALDETKDNDIALINNIKAEIATKCVLAGVTPLYIFDKSFTYPLGSAFDENIENITHIKSSCEISLTEGEEYTLNPNENIYLKAPNYITQEQYGAFVKCFYQLGTGYDINIPKGSTYQLTFDDYIAFFWKKDDDSEYEYKIFKAGDFIKPQFRLHSDKLDANGANVTETPKEDNQKADTAIRKFITDSTTQLSGSLDGKTVVVDGTTYNIAECVALIQDRTLSSKQTIDIVSPNAINIEAGDKIYFRRNTTYESGREKVYQLISGDILGSGEYIYYSKNPRSSMTELGAGTEIQFELKSGSILKAKALDTAEKIVEFSLAPLKYLMDNDLWIDCESTFNIDQADGPQLIENQFYNFGEGVKIKLNKSCKLTSANYESIKSSIEYQDPEADSTADWITIPAIQADDGWKARTFLNITGSALKPQKLEANHSITINDGSDPIKSKFIQFSPELNLLGDSIDGYSVDASMKLTACVYDQGTALAVKLDTGALITESSMVTSDTVHIADIFAKNATASSITITTTITLPKSTKAYLLPFDLIGPNTGFSEYSAGRIRITGDSDTTKYHTGRNYIKLSTDDNNSQFEITFTITETEGNDYPQSITIYNPITYMKNIYVDGFVTDSTLSKYDPDSRFQYDLEIPSADQILNPLDAKSFLDSDHPYHRCAICKWILPSEVDNQIRITNKIK